MQSTDNHQGEVHAKIEHLKQLGFSKGQNDDATYFCQCYSTEDLKEVSHATDEQGTHPLTELPISDRARQARSNRVSPWHTEKYRAICAQNSTAIPTD